MTPNNEVKAPLPCTLPKEWVGTGIIDSYKAIIYTYPSSRNKYRVDVVSGHTRYSKEHSNVSDMMVSYREAIQAIASAQRPWLKAEGFQFVEGKRYIISDGEDWVIGYYSKSPYTYLQFYNMYDFYSENCEDAMHPDAIVAFKPYEDSQEAWDAVAHVEVYKGVV